MQTFDYSYRDGSKISEGARPADRNKKSDQVPFILNAKYSDTFIQNRLSRRHEVSLFECEAGLAHNPETSFLIKVSGSSMIGAGIESGDMLLVDRDVEPCDKNVVVAAINNKLLVKRLRHINNDTYLFSENIDFAPIKIMPDDNLDIWGVVKMVIKDR